MIVVFVHLKSKPGMSTAFVDVAKQLAAASQTEAGCLAYELFQESENSFWILEKYIDEAAAQAHRSAPHFRTLGRQMGEYLDGKPEIVRPSVLA